MKILLIVPAEYKGTGWGGVMTYTLLLAQEFKRRSHKVTILTPGPKNQKLFFRRVPIYKVAYSKLRLPGQYHLNRFFPLTLDRLKWMFGVYRFVKKYGPYDIIECPEWGSSALLLSLERKPKVVARLHRSLIQYYRDNNLPITFDLRLVNVFELTSIIFASAVSSPTYYMVSTHPWVIKLINTYRTPIQIIPNGVVIPKVKYPFRLKNKFLLSVGRLEKGKGTLMLVRAFIQIHSKFPWINLVIIGRDTQIWENGNWLSYKEIIEKNISKHKANQYIIIKPQLNQRKIMKYYQQCFLYVIPSIGHENHPYSLLDAVRYSKAIVASDAGGIPETFDDGKNGFLFREGNLEDLIRKMQKLLADSKLRSRMENYNLTDRNKFNIKMTANKTVKLYNEIVGFRAKSSIIE